MSKKWLIILIITAAGAGIGWFVTSAVQAGIHRTEDGKKAAEAAVLDSDSLVSAEKTTVFNGPTENSKPVYAVYGRNAGGKEAASLVRSGRLKEKPVTVILSDIISESRASKISRQEYSPKKMISVKLGLLPQKNKQVPVWEVKYIDSYSRYTYDYIDAKSGTMLAHIAIK
ncbi:hypothetical protein GKZ89_01870 [Bacillus mangrovi]|uniref:PepSY domain-containing protein n=1 Tax=Metabacillus mangrovi TaxID=1491830 RepID=A0A7X2S2R2_9BACI|nr:PepSY domain-containing protein [Metabacillus mangrovi]MTH52136.1 hypothetical protein [Metabacillus mangrovi]